MAISASSSSLKIEGLLLAIHIGWTEEERLKKQDIEVTIEVNFAVLPTATQTDELEDALDYHSLIDKVQALTANKHYRLIEHLCAHIHQMITGIVKNAQVKTKVIKRPSGIANFSGTCAFELVSSI